MRVAACLLHGDDFVEDLTDATREKGPAVDHHVDLVGAGRAPPRERPSTSRSSEARPDGKDVATDATATGDEPSTERACATRSG